MGLYSQTFSVSENLRTVFCPRRRWFPPAGNTRIEQFIRIRLMVPDGDRRQTAQSRDIINEPHTTRMKQNDIVRVFVLHNDIFHQLNGRLSQTPSNNVLERFLRGKQVFDTRANMCRR